MRGGVAGNAGPVGNALLNVNGDATSCRVIYSVSVNFTPIRQNAGSFVESGEYAVFWGTRYATDRFGTDDIRGWSNVFGGDFKFDISNVADIGLTGTVRIGSGRNNAAYAVGPVLTVAPFTNANITIGYNIIGFENRDFGLARYGRSGPFLTFKMKFDQTSLPGYKF